MSEINYITRSLGKPNGASQSALDVLVALSSTRHMVNLIYIDSQNTPSSLDGVIIKTKNIFQGPTCKKFPKLSHIRTITKNTIRWIDSKVNDRLRVNKLLKHTEPNLTLVNGLGADRYWDRIRKNMTSNQNTILIVRESPRHFTNHDDKNIINNIKEILNKYDYIIFVSDILRYEWNKISGIEPNRTFYIPNCAHENKTNHLLSISKQKIIGNLEYNYDMFNILCIGSIQHRKGQDIIINIADEIHNIHDRINIYFVGPVLDKRFLKLLKEQMKNLKKKNRTFILGPRSNALEYIYGADMLIVPSRAEAFQRTILESMALGTPTIASDVDGINEQLNDNKSGFFFNIDSPLSMLEPIKKIFHKPEVRKSIGRASRSRYNRKFSRIQQIKRIHDMLDSVL